MKIIKAVPGTQQHISAHKRKLYIARFIANAGNANAYVQHNSLTKFKVDPSYLKSNILI